MTLRPTAIERRRAPKVVPWCSVAGLVMPCQLRLLPLDDDPVDDKIDLIISTLSLDRLFSTEGHLHLSQQEPASKPASPVPEP